METASTTAIQFNDVSFSAEGDQILRSISGDFPEGKITTLVGPSGAGKTTLIKLCNGLISPDSGEILIKGKPIHDYEPTELRRKVGLALQSATMTSGTVMDNLNMPRQLQGEELPEAEAKELLYHVGLQESFLHHRTKDLSGGQRQKVSIARTLVNRPKILLLDEITSSLDRVSQQDIETLIAKINHSYGTTIIWITHNLHQALNVGDFTWVMMAGEVVETGESSLLNAPKTERVQRFVKGEIE
ncbi:phosphate ABC transporter ATP-binding protein [Lentibacillus sediminis]|uniref:ABC transporter ATP-binding protein n=1 Tax=Lentibacillus sediminis TaxID=1940529 RepID=UPI000C1BE159|nr:phosphate ABC transporter ATP-binding protein [Lentibacillus sediminis]